MDSPSTIARLMKGRAMQPRLKIRENNNESLAFPSYYFSPRYLNGFSLFSPPILFCRLSLNLVRIAPMGLRRSAVATILQQYFSNCSVGSTMTVRCNLGHDTRFGNFFVVLM